MPQFLRTWMLAFAMLLGGALYFAWMALPCGAIYEAYAIGAIQRLQPILIASMLFATFCKVELRKMRPRPWHAPLLLLQCVGSVGFALLHRLIPGVSPLLFETALLCLCCPTATAAAVVTGKLGGDVEGVVGYTVLANLSVAVLIPSLVPWIAPRAEQDFLLSAMLIVARILPMLILPFLVAIAVRRFLPALHRKIAGIKDLAFYLWAVSLTLAITVSTRSLVETSAPWTTLCGIGMISLIACIVQFRLGRRWGRKHRSSVAASQALGQKNTVFLIWAGYTFFDPVSSIAGGFYSIWHNLWNSYQLSQANRLKKQETSLSES